MPREKNERGSLNVIPCSQNKDLRKLIKEFSEVLKVEAHKLGTHGLGENDFYNSGLFRGAIERVRGQFSATMGSKREFARDVLNHMQDRGFIENWESSGEKNRHDYTVHLPNHRVAVIELKGCMDGNNTVIYERPPHAQEFIVWSLCTNTGGNPKLNAWSGIHTRIGADMLGRPGQRVDGVIIWDMMCGTTGRPCPKIQNSPERLTLVSHYELPPPCIYVFPSTVASPRNNPTPAAQALEEVRLLRAFHDCFAGRPEEVNYVDFAAQYRGNDLVRTTRIRRAGTIVQESKPTPVQRV
jgi:hypothetical protein